MPAGYNPFRIAAGGMEGYGAVITAALLLKPQAFALGDAMAGGAPGLWIALLAGLSQSVGQAFILFVNRVRPLRFALSLLVEAVLFAAGFLAWAVSTWLVARGIFGAAVTLQAVTRALGVAHAPQLLGFLGALPYLGVPWLTVISLWTAIAFVVGLVSASGLSVWSAFTSLVAGWLVMHALQRSAGQPLVRLGRGLLDRAAGVPLARDGRSLASLLEGGPPGPGRPGGG